MNNLENSSVLPFIWGKQTYIMGILNITPDSFSGDGLWNKSSVLDSALRQAEQFIFDGADILDVGGESTRPGAEVVNAEQELERVIPVVEALCNEFDTIVSIDTYKSSVAKAALEAGAKMVNDVWGFKADPALAQFVKDFDVPVILMHNRSKPANAAIAENLGGRYVGVEYNNLIEDIKKELLESVKIAKDHDIQPDKIILDPGVGFGKTVPQNLDLINQLGAFKTLGYPILLGPSRKSFIGYTLDLPPDQRVEGTGAAVVVGITRGADIIRVHDVRAMTRIARMTDAIVR